ncbi:MAG: FapA family protein [Acetatifactor sp.]|nr:FapA family protein [Acetatifactor sp.]
MQNGYFRLENRPEGGGYGIGLYEPQGDGDRINIDELTEYLDGLNIKYDRKKMERLGILGGDCFYPLELESTEPVPERFHLSVSDDNMSAAVRFYPPSTGGRRLSLDDFLDELSSRKVEYGIRVEALHDHFFGAGIWCTDILVAKGVEATEGTDARIEYNFNTDNHRHPQIREDGSTDYFHLTTINQCSEGDVLARIIPEVPGKAGCDVYGTALKAKEVKRETLKFGKNIELSEDRRTITSMVKGHVMLVDGKVIVSEVYEVKGVDVSTGNLEYDGSIEVNGDVAENFEIKAGGNVIVNGIVEGAKIIAGGNIVITKGMNGMGKGFLKAGGDIIVKFLENTRVAAGGYVQAEAIMHSRISAGTDVRVEGKRGTIVGGYVQAGSKVSARYIGASMGASTILEVGVNPLIKMQYSRMQKAIADHGKTVKNAEVILLNFREKLKRGFKYNESQIKYVKSVAKLVEEKNAELEQLNNRMEKLREMMETQSQAEILVSQEIFPGTTIIIGEASKTIHTSYNYCRFVKEMGEIRMAAMK